ncbi:hypothetical protein L9F63_000184 [Diploptera punctata]|uniref:HMG box domain-containing protein n=1 Tax=Diploptera punctata TaxID=6984 RepID=A0AAD8AN46_DIPPU|nr:hypothetical protein L9F63_000184 [Diploptera punctata]
MPDAVSGETLGNYKPQDHGQQPGNLLQDHHNLEVTGVSRSGRVRKKSSKLMDFESPDEIDNRYKRRNDRNDPSVSATPVSSHSMASNRGRKPHQMGAVGSMMDKSQSMIKVEPHSEMSEEEITEEYNIKQEPQSSESDLDLGMYQPPDGEEDSSMDSLGSDTKGPFAENELTADLSLNSLLPPQISEESLPSQAQSLYMLEKSSKKKLIIRDGKIVGRMKAQRKDKGKSRFTAYMLWAKDIRQDILRATPEVSFATMSKRLGELWATVPTNEKYNWKRRAKRLAVKSSSASNTSNTLNTESVKYKSTASKSKFINKLGGRAQQQQQQQQQHQQQQHHHQQIQQGSRAVAGSVAESKPGKAGLVTEPVVGPGLYKVVGTQPVDVAAHLKLLGESLTIIGERLKEHEGQIAVSGSLSVLLDSLLCALGPLLCLTQQVPETNGCPQEMLNKILDNIAYFMPGL